MKRLIIASVMLASACLPAMAKCHGHSTPDGKWTWDDSSWSDEEIGEMSTLTDKLKKAFPLATVAYTPAHTASTIDQLECQGFSHEKAIQLIVQVTNVAEEAKK